MFTWPLEVFVPLRVHCLGKNYQFHWCNIRVYQRIMAWEIIELSVVGSQGMDVTTIRIVGDAEILC